MRKYIIVLSVLLLTVAEFARAADDNDAVDKLEQGKQLAFETRKGNCLACHIIADGELAGNLGPPLVMMTARFPDRAKLRAQIWDATVLNTESSMPPFGRHRMLTEQEIDLVVDFILTL